MARRRRYQNQNRNARSKAQNDRVFERTRRKRLQYRVRNILLLAIFLGLFALGFNRVIAYEDGTTRRTFTVEGTIPVPVLEMHPAHGETALVAVVAHGFSGSKDLMTGFGVELARAGVTAYLFDFPGHGESPVPLASNTSSDRNGPDNLTALDEVVNYVRSHNTATHSPKIILLGHSMGSTAVGDYVMAHANESDLISTILISPVGNEHPTRTQPKNLLMLVGQNDIPATITNSMRLLQLGCGLSATQSQPASTQSMECGNPADGTGRRAVVLPNLNHITILNASGTFQEMLNWLHRTYPQAVNTSHMQSDVRLAWLLLGVVGILLAMFPLCSIILDMFDINGIPRPFRGQDVLFFALCALVGIAVAISIQYLWQPFGFVHVLLGDYVTGYFFFTALVTALIILAVRRMLPIPRFHQAIVQMLIGILLALFLYFTLGQLATFAWQRFTLSLPRLLVFALISVLIWPLFLLDEGISRGSQEYGFFPGVLTSVAFKALLVTGLIVAISLTPGLGFLSIVLPVLVLMFVLLIAFGTQLYVSGKAAIAAATLSALVVAWSMAASFPITS